MFSGDESLSKLILPATLIILLFLGMASTLVYAGDNGDNGDCKSGGNCNGDNKGSGYNGNGYGGNWNEGSWNSGDNGDAGSKKGTESGNWNGPEGNTGNGYGHDWKGNDNRDRWNSDNGDARYSAGKSWHGQKSTSNVAIGKTTVVQHATSILSIQVSEAVLLVTCPAAATVGLTDASTWSVFESNAERFFRKFFFLSGSVGERIRRRNVLRNGKRKQIYNIILNNPSTHFRKITRMAGVGPNQCSWHLRILEKMGFIKSEHVGRYLTYRANNTDYDNSRRSPTTIIQNSTATKVLEYLLNHPDVKIAELPHALMMNRNTISYHIKKMRSSGLIQRNGVRISLTANSNTERSADASRVALDKRRTQMVQSFQ